MDRKKKLRSTQITLLLLGGLLIFFTYSNKIKTSKEVIISQEQQKKIKKQIASDSQNGDVFFNIEYSGLDLAGNRYILKSEEAFSEKSSPDIVNMKVVKAVFYFKDDTNLKIWSDKGIYNNKTLDMKFDGNVKAIYENSVLNAQEAEYLNSEGFLKVTKNVKIKDLKGTVFADKLLFDIKKQTLNIASFDDNKVNANVNLK